MKRILLTLMFGVLQTLIGEIEIPELIEVNPNLKMGKYEVTNKQFCDVYQWAYDKGKIDISGLVVTYKNSTSLVLLNMGYTDSQITFSNGVFSVAIGKDLFPCTGISQIGAYKYCYWLNTINKVSGYWYKLPEKSEWLEAAEGDTSTLYSGSDDPLIVAWFKENDDDRTHEVGEDKISGIDSANEFGFYDMTGNVMEWCNNKWRADNTGLLYLLRGSSWGYSRTSSEVTTSMRGYTWNKVGGYIGFRLSMIKLNP